MLLIESTREILTYFCRRRLTTMSGAIELMIIEINDNQMKLDKHHKTIKQQQYA